MRTLIALFSILTVIALTNCKPANKGAQLKTLEDMASGGDLTEVQCSGDLSKASQLQAGEKDIDSFPLYAFIEFRSKVTPDQEKSIRAALKGALTAIPADLQNILIWLKTTIVVTGDLSVCPSDLYGDRVAMASSGLNKAKGCHVVTRSEQDGKRKVDKVEILVQPDEQAILHSFVKLVGYVFSTFVSHAYLLDDKSSFDVFNSDSDALVNYKEKLARSYLSDLYTSRAIFPVESVEGFLGNGAGAIIDEVMKAGKDLPSDIFNKFTYRLAQDASDPSNDIMKLRHLRFLDFVFANAFDSYHCHAYGSFDQNAVTEAQAKTSFTVDERKTLFASLSNTQETMHYLFPYSYLTFSDLDLVMVAIGKRYGGLQPDANAELNLTGADLTGLNFSSLLSSLSSLFQGSSGLSNLAVNPSSILGAGNTLNTGALSSALSSMMGSGTIKTSGNAMGNQLTSMMSQMNKLLGTSQGQSMMNILNDPDEYDNMLQDLQNLDLSSLSSLSSLGSLGSLGSGSGLGSSLISGNMLGSLLGGNGGSILGAGGSSGSGGGSVSSTGTCPSGQSSYTCKTGSKAGKKVCYPSQVGWSPEQYCK